MKRPILLGITLVLTACSVQAQTLNEYLSLRKQHKISQAVGIAALESFVGERVMEVQGVVRGSFTMGGQTQYLVERTDGQHIQVSAKRPVDWLGGNAVKARLLVHANRPTETSEIKAELLGAAVDQEIARIEYLDAQKRAKQSPKTARLTGPIGSRGASKPPQNWNLPSHEAIPVYAGFIKNYNKRLSDAKAIEIASGIIGFSIRYGVDARLIMAMVLVESGFNPSATSRSGAMGLGQLMPGTANGMGVSNAYDTMQNLYGTVRLVRGHIDKYTKKTGDGFEGLVLALAAYNAGSGNVRKHGGVPPFRETQNYIRKVISTYNQFAGK